MWEETLQLPVPIYSTAKYELIGDARVYTRCLDQQPLYPYNEPGQTGQQNSGATLTAEEFRRLVTTTP